MAKKQKESASDDGLADLQRPAAELLYGDELEKLAQAEKNQSRPKGWKLSA